MASADAIRLFGTFERTDSAPAAYSEKQFAFLNRSARQRDARIRDMLEVWFAEYPADDQRELKRRFETVKAQSYESAFFELSLHAILKRLGCTATAHPNLPEITTRPEFLIIEPSGSTFILEARLAGGQSAAEESLNRLKDTVYDVLNRRIKTNDFCISVSIHGEPKEQPSSKKIAEFVQAELDVANADEVALLGPADAPRWVFNVHHGCSIHFRPIPRKPEKRGKPPERPIGMTTESGWVVDDVQPIQDAVLEKADKYGEMTLPYVVAVNSMAFSLEPDDITKAITGLWSHERIKRVSAVLLAAWLMPISAAHAPTGLFHNPMAERPYSGVLTALPQGFTEDGKIRMIEGRTLNDIFGVAADWPRLGSDD